MSRPLTNAELVLLQTETNYLNAGIPVGGSVVSYWNGAYILIYHSPGAGYQVTDVSDLPTSTIAELSKWTPADGVLYSLPAGIQAGIKDAAEAVVSLGGTAAQVSEGIAAAVGLTLKNLLKPVVEALMVPLVIAGIVAAVYLMKK